MSTFLEETKYARYFIETGIMHIIFQPELVITIEVAKQMSEDRIRICKGVGMPLYVDANALASIDTQARKYFATGESLLYAKAVGILAESLVTKLAVNLYMKVDKPLVPVKLFTTREKALKWLEQYK